MIDIIGATLASLAVFFRSRLDLSLEVLALRQQVAVLKRKHRRPMLSRLDRLFWVMLRTVWPPLTRFGVRHILKTCLAQAQASIVTLRSKRLYPHSMRHSTAIALLKSGVDLSTIAQWLEHASIATTNRYAAIDLEMKRKAIANIKPLQGSQNRSRHWRLKQSVLEWLEAL